MRGCFVNRFTISTRFRVAQSEMMFYNKMPRSTGLYIYTSCATNRFISIVMPKRLNPLSLRLTEETVTLFLYNLKSIEFVYFFFYHTQIARYYKCDEFQVKEKK